MSEAGEDWSNCAGWTAKMCFAYVLVAVFVLCFLNRSFQLQLKPKAMAALKGALITVSCIPVLQCGVEGAVSQPNTQMGEAIADLLKNELTGKSDEFVGAFQDALASRHDEST